MNNNTKTILSNRYLLKDSDNNIIETPEDCFRRVANFIAKDDGEANKFYQMMVNGDGLPNSPTLANAGVDGGGSLSACFVLTPQDNTISIFDTLKDAALIVKNGGGVGFGFSKLRPHGDAIKTVHKNAIGPVRTMRMYSNVLREWTQNGSFREAALMGQLHIDHPDVMEFIRCKDDFKILDNFNISVQITDEFMNAVENDALWYFINPRDNSVIQDTIPAREIFNAICESAHRTGDPGVVFYDRVLETHPNPQRGNINSSNPCGEEFLEDYGSCNLGSINLGHCIDNNGEVDYIYLSQLVHNMVLMLNRVIDVNSYPLKEIEIVNKATRRIGLGVMGWADLLVELGLSYDSDDAIRLAGDLSEFILECARATSYELAKDEGVFPDFYMSNLDKDVLLRNSSLTTIAPTGSISRIAECSFGIEPYYDIAWKSNVLWKEGSYVEMFDCAQPIRKALEDRYGVYANDKINQSINHIIVLKNKNNIDELKEFIKDLGLNYDLFITSSDISVKRHIDMQAAWQRGVTNSISKTINMPNEATVEDVANAYKYAHSMGCKGITIYRNNSREVEVLSKNITNNDIILNNTNFIRPPIMKGSTDKIITGHGSMYVTVNKDDNDIIREVFTNISKSGGCYNASLEVVSRIISLALQYNIPIDDIVKQLENITCCPNWFDGKLIRSPYDGLAHILRQNKSSFLPQKERDVAITNISQGMLCKKCHSLNISIQEGCMLCLDCGDSRCG